MTRAYAHLAIVHSTEYANAWNNPGPDHLERALEMARKGAKATDATR
jgi:hypothetical protein